MSEAVASLTLRVFCGHFTSLCPILQTWRASPDLLLFNTKECEGTIGGDIPGKGGNKNACKSFLLKCLVESSRQHLDTLQMFIQSHPDREVGEQDTRLCSFGRASSCARMEMSSGAICRDIFSAELRLHLLISTFTTTACCNISGVLLPPTYAMRPVKL